MSDQPPRIDPDKLDFSGFHALDHFPFTAYCRDLPGGARNHLSMWWDFVGRSRLREVTTCRLGWHDPGTYWRMGERPSRWQGCVWCGKHLSEETPA